jgi:sarcosine oxidase subunit delta
MKIMPCPFNGPRNITEFSYFGPVRREPNFETATDDEWAAFIFIAPNPDGLIREWWCHAPTNTFFIAERDTVSDTIVRTYYAHDVSELVPVAEGKLSDE